MKLTMKRNKVSLISGLCALILLSVVCATNVFAADEVTVTGRVYASDWDDKDNVTAATINDYVIVDNAIGKELFKLELKVVKASGVIGKDSDYNKTITVIKYEVMPEPE